MKRRFLVFESNHTAVRLLDRVSGDGTGRGQLRRLQPPDEELLQDLNEIQLRNTLRPPSGGPGPVVRSQVTADGY